MGSKGSRFYCPSHTTKVIESDRVIYFEDDTDTSQGPKEILFREHPIVVPMPVASTPTVSPTVDQHPVAIHDELIEQAI